jgi:hypothetical protein
MSDEVPRSAPGNPPDQRRRQQPPAWWEELERRDLPDDPVVADRAGNGTPRRRVLWLSSHHVSAPSVSLPRALVLVLVAAFTALLVAWLGVGMGSMGNAVLATLLVAVPTLVAAAAAWIVVRHGD